MRRWILKFFGYWRPKDEKKWRLENLTAAEWYATAEPHEIKEHFNSLRSDDLSDAEYAALYDNDAKAIAEAKAAWRAAGELVVEGTKQMVNRDLRGF